MEFIINKKFNKFIYFVFLVLICLVIFLFQQFRINNISKEVEEMKIQNTNQKMFILEMEDRLDRINHNFASGGGKITRSFPSSKSDSIVQLNDFFSFDRHHFLYESSGNEGDFFLNTDVIDNLEILKDSYYLLINAKSISNFKVSQYDSNGYRLSFDGIAIIDFNFKTKVNSEIFDDIKMDEVEHAMFKVELIDGGIGGSSSGDSIEITLKPNSVDAPLLFKVFGDNEIFSGKLDIAEITINNPKR